MSNQNNRIEWIDILKGIGIILVIIGHSFRDEMRIDSSIANWIYSIIYYFHMPLFYVISGYLFRITQDKLDSYSVVDYIYGKIKSYIKPFVCYSLLVYIVFWCCNSIPYLSRLLSNTSLKRYEFFEYVNLSLKGDNPYAFHLWYLWVLFWIIILSFVVYRIGNRFKINYTILLFMIAFIMWNVRLFIDSNNACMLIKAILKHTIYFYVGIKLDDIVINSSRVWYKFLSVFSWGYASLYVVGMLKSTYVVTKYLLNLAVLVTVIIIVSNLCILSRKINNSSLRYIGSNSLWFYLFHQPFCCAILGSILYYKFNVPILISCILCILSSLGIVTCLNLLVEKNAIIRRIRQMLFE